jgi:hypothetical protein
LFGWRSNLLYIMKRPKKSCLHKPDEAEGPRRFWVIAVTFLAWQLCMPGAFHADTPHEDSEPFVAFFVAGVPPTDDFSSGWSVGADFILARDRAWFSGARIERVHLNFKSQGALDSLDATLFHIVAYRAVLFEEPPEDDSRSRVTGSVDFSFFWASGSKTRPSSAALEPMDTGLGLSILILDNWWKRHGWFFRGSFYFWEAEAHFNDTDEKHRLSLRVPMLTFGYTYRFNKK